MAKLDAIFVDFDGTLVDSELANAMAYVKAIGEEGIECSIGHVVSLIVGRHWSQFLPEILGASYTLEIGTRISNSKKVYYRSYYNDVLVNYALVKLLKSLASKTKIGIVTNASKDSIYEILKSKCIFDIFSIFVCSEDVRKRKPDPEPYFVAMSKLSTCANNCIAIEDSEVGIRSALAAGIKVLKVSLRV